MSLPPIILASQSPRRQQLLQQAGIEFTVCVLDTPEEFYHACDPATLCTLNAQAKAKAVVALYPNALVLGADTLVFLDSETLGKPETEDDAIAMLQKLSGRTHTVCTSVYYVSPQSEGSFADLAQVTFKPLDLATIRQYMSLVNVMDKAGSYGYQEHRDLIVESVQGDTNTVIGLPLARVLNLLQGLGYVSQL